MKAAVFENVFDLRVRGSDGLRVVDASVMSAIVSGNLNAPVQIIVERAAGLIPGRERLHAQPPAFHFWER